MPQMDNHDRRHSPYTFLLFFVFQIVIWFWTTKKRHTHHRYGNELTLYFESIFFCKRKTNERLLLCFMSHLSMIILSHPYSEKKSQNSSQTVVVRRAYSDSCAFMPFHDIRPSITVTVKHITITVFL